jgi:hypothetical protein
LSYHRHLRENRRMFWKVRAMPAATVWWGCMTVYELAAEIYLALSGLIDAGEQIEHRGFAGSVGAYEAHKLAGAISMLKSLTA